MSEALTQQIFGYGISLATQMEPTEVPRYLQINIPGDRDEDNPSDFEMPNKILGLPLDNKYAALQLDMEGTQPVPKRVVTLQLGLDSDGEFAMMWGEHTLPLEYNEEYDFFTIKGTTIRITLTDYEVPSKNLVRPQANITFRHPDKSRAVTYSFDGSLKWKPEVYKDDVSVKAAEIPVLAETRQLHDLLLPLEGFPDVLAMRSSSKTIEIDDMAVGDTFTEVTLKTGISKKGNPYSIIEAVDSTGAKISFFAPSTVIHAIADAANNTKTDLEITYKGFEETASKDGTKMYKNHTFEYTLHDHEASEHGPQCISVSHKGRFAPKLIEVLGELDEYGETLTILGLYRETSGKYPSVIAAFTDEDDEFHVAQIPARNARTYQENAYIDKYATLEISSLQRNAKGNQQLTGSQIMGLNYKQVSLQSL
jgi:hypothetical protein